MKKIIIIAFAILLASTGAISQKNSYKATGVAYTTGTPNFTPVRKSEGEFAIDSTTGKWWQYSYQSAAWVHLGYWTAETGTSGAPSYTPNKVRSPLAINAGDSLYHYRSGTWYLINGGGGGGGGITDGDKGDIDVTSSGTVWTVDTNAITTIKIADYNVTLPKIAQGGATTGQILKWNGTTWAPDTDAGAAGGGIYGVSDTVTNDHTAVIDSGLTFTSSIASSKFHVTTDATTYGTGFYVIPDSVRIRRFDIGGSTEIRLISTGILLFTTSPDRVTIQGADARYFADYRGTYDSLSIIHKDYADDTYLQNVDSLFISGDTLYTSLARDSVAATGVSLATYKQTLSVDSATVGSVERFAFTISDGNTVYIDVPASSGSGAGQNNVGANLGAGTGVYAGKTDTTLNFKSLVEGYGVDFTSTSTEITIAADTSQLATLSDVASVRTIYTDTGTVAGKDDFLLRLREDTTFSIGHTNTYGFDDYWTLPSPTDYFKGVYWSPVFWGGVGLGNFTFDPTELRNYVEAFPDIVRIGSEASERDNNAIIVIGAEYNADTSLISFQFNRNGTFYSYNFPVASPSTANNDTTIMAWRGDGADHAPIGFVPLPSNTDTSGYNLSFVRSNDTLYLTDGDGTLFAVLPADLDEQTISVDSADIGSDIERFAISISNGNTVYIDVAKVNGAQNNVGENLGAGVGVYAGKSDTTLQFKSLVEGYGVDISATSTEITIKADTTQLATLTDVGTVQADIAGHELADGDLSATNELQTIAIDSAIVGANERFSITLSDGGGTVTFDVPQPDGTGTDDQTLSIDSSNIATGERYAISIESGNTIYLDDDDQQQVDTFTYSAGTLSLSIQRDGQPAKTVSIPVADGSETVVTAGTSIGVTGSGTTGSPYVITNSAPDQTVVLTPGTGIGVSGTYPSFTITNTTADTVGTNWTARSATEANAWMDVCYGNGMFVAVANTGTNRVMVSVDGILWTPVAVTSGEWEGVGYGNGMFVAVGSDASGDNIMISPNGLTWTRLDYDDNYYDVIYAEDKFIVAPGNTDYPMYSYDGVTWVENGQSKPANPDPVACAYGDGLFVVSGGNGASGYSDDGITWSASGTLAGAWNDIAYGHGLFVMTSTGGSNRKAYSTDGNSWSTIGTGTYSTAISYGNGLFVSLNTSGGGIEYSYDGINWTAKASAVESNAWEGICYGNGIFVAVSSTGTNRVTTSGSIDRYIPLDYWPNGVRDNDKGDVDVTTFGTVWTVDTSAITTIKIAANAVDSTKVGTGALSVTDLGQHGASTDDVLTWNGTQWYPAANHDAQTLSIDSATVGSVERFAISISNGNTIYMDIPASSGSGGGQNNVGANLGAGVGVYAGKTDTTLNFKSLVEGYGVDISATSTEITIEADTTQLATITDVGAVQADIDAHELADGDLDDENEIQDLTITGSSSPFTLDISGSANDVNVASGTGISLSESPANTLVVTNSAPDQTVVLNNGTGISVTGTYPTFTVTNSAPNVTTDLTFTGASSPYTLNSSDGTDVTVAQGTGITLSRSSNELTVTNAAPDQTVVLNNGTGINVTGTYPTFTVTNSSPNVSTDLTFTGSSAPYTLNSSDGTDVTVAQGTGITLSRSSNELTVTNSAPDQTVVLNNGTGISVTGTYPTFTVTNTVSDTDTDDQNLSIGGSGPYTLDITDGTGVTVSAGTGISLSESPANTLVVTNSAPDQTVSISDGGGIGVSGTYPSFTLTATDASITNEGSLTVGAGGGNSSTIVSNTSGSTAVTLEGGSNVTISESGSTITISATPGAGVTDLTFTGSSSPYTLNSSTGTDVTVAEGTGITISRSSNELTVANSAPDQTVVLNEGTGIDVTGTYPTFTIASTITDTDDQTLSIDSATIGGIERFEISISNGNSVSFDVSNTVGTVTSVGITQPAAGITVSGSPITSSGNMTLALANDLAGVEGLSSTGIAVRTGDGTWATRSISASALSSSYIGIGTANTGGVSGNPTFSFNNHTATSKLFVQAVSTTNLDLSGTETIDGVSISAGQRVLVTGQTDQEDNGIYDCAAGAWTRSADADAASKLDPSVLVAVKLGTTNGATFWKLDTKGPYTLGTTDLVFSKVFQDESATNEIQDLSITGASSPFTLDISGSSNDINFASGTGISLSESPANTLVVTNSAPDQTVVLNNGTGINVTGTYPTFTIASTVSDTDTDDQNLSIGGSGPYTLDITDGTGVTVSAGTGISLSESPANTLVVTNASPDQTVVLNDGTGISVTGTYPTFTVTNSAPNVTTDLTFTGGSSPYTLNSSDGTDVTFTNGSGITITRSSNDLSFAATDPSLSNEGSLTVGAGSGTTSTIVSNTSGSTAVTIEASTGLSISESGSTITLTNTGDTNASDDITGSGVSGRVAYFDGTQTVTSDADLTFNGAQVGIGTSPASGQRLYIKQSTTNDGIVIERSSSSANMRLYQDAASYMEGSGNMVVKTTGGTITLEPPGGSAFIAGVTVAPTAAKTDTFAGSTMLEIAGTYSPTIASVLTGYPSMARLGTTINMSGGSNQPMNGLFIDPVITAAPNGFRGINYRPSTHTFLWQENGDTVRSFLRGKLGIGPDRSVASYRLDVGGTDGIRVPVGSTAQRPTGAAGVIRFNEDVGVIEYHDGSDWQSAAGGSASELTLTAAPGTNNTASGTKTTFTANENQAFGDIVYIASDGDAAIADADGIATARVVAMCIGTVSGGGSGTYLLSGFARNDSWAWTVGQAVYLSTTGTSTNTLTQTAPSGTDDCVVYVGMATHADRILFNPSTTIIEVK